MPGSLSDIASSISSPVEARLFAEYGAIFATTATPPPAIVFPDADAVRAYQSQLCIRRARLGAWDLELQEPAMDALLAATAEGAARGASLTPRAADAARRDYDDTVRLWNRNVTRGLEHWRRVGRLSEDRAEAIRRLSRLDQVATVLSIEDGEQLYFGTFFDRSILYSVAAPGASQHLSLLAFDVAEHDDPTVERVLNELGWFRTVANDLPHFTYLGHESDNLPILGLRLVERDAGDRRYSFWVPDTNFQRGLGEGRPDDGKDVSCL
ncbi:MAG TPA: hypothetical protein VJH03_26800 [Blastocatellia bacterium]|nr:hypothetical protein [Blastocatellia bacterium]